MSRLKHLHLLILACTGFLIYSNTFFSPFQFDDIMYILENPRIRDLGNFTDLSGARYVGLLSFALNYALGGYDTLGYHLVNTSIHVFNGLFVYSIVIFTFRTPLFRGSVRGEQALASSIAFVTSVIFIAHPIQTQAITYITQRFASLAAFFYLLTLLLYVKARLSMTEQTRGPTPTGARVKTVFLCLLALAAAVIAQKTKEISFTLPVMIALYEFIFFRGSMGRWPRPLFVVPFLLAMLIIPLEIIRPYTESTAGDISVGEKIRLLQMEDLKNISRLDYLLTQFTVIVTYLRLLVLPINQNVLYDYPAVRTVMDLRVALSFVLLSTSFAAALYLFIRTRSGNPLAQLLCFGVFWFFLTLSVESSVIPIKHVIFEHRVYLPSVGIITAFGAAFFIVTDRVERNFHLAGARVSLRWTVVFLIALCLSTAAYLRNNVWRDNLVLWQDVTRKSPGLASSHYNLAWAYHERDDKPSAIIHYKEALKIDPGKAKAHYNLAKVYQDSGDDRSSIVHYLEAVRLDPGNKDAHYNLAVAYYRVGDMTSAIAHYRDAIEVDPSYEDAHYNLAWTYEHIGDVESAVAHYREVIRLNPDSADARYNLGNIYMEQNLLDEAVREFRAALEVKPDYIEAGRGLEKALKQKGLEMDKR